jgi:hypothetical protein
MLTQLAAAGPGPAPFVLIGGFVALVIIILVVGKRVSRKRRAAIAQVLMSQGWTAQPEPTDADKSDAFQPFAYLNRLPDGPKGIEWCARGQLAEHPAALIEYQYSTGSGKSRQTHCLTLLHIAAPAAWPLVTLFPESFFHRIGEKLGLKADLKLENETFNKRWRIASQSDDTALAILSSDIQELLQIADSAEWWAFGAGGIVLCHTRHYKPDKLGTVMHRMEELLRRLDPALRSALPRGRDVPPPVPAQVGSI